MTAVNRIESLTSTDGNPDHILEMTSFSGVNGTHTETRSGPSDSLGSMLLPCNISWIHRSWMSRENAYAVYSFTIDTFYLNYNVYCLQQLGGVYGFTNVSAGTGLLARAEIVYDPTGGDITRPPLNTLPMVGGTMFRHAVIGALPMGTVLPNKVTGSPQWSGSGAVWSNGSGNGTVVGVSGDCLERPPITREARSCDGSSAIVVDLESNTESKPNAKYQGDIYTPGDNPGKEDPVGVVWTSELCDTEPGYPVLSQCLDPSATILADDADRSGEPRAEYQGVIYTDTGERAFGDPVPVTWTTDPCPTPPVYRLCGPAPTYLDGLQLAFRSRIEDDTADLYFFNDTFPLDGRPSCKERWFLYYERVEDDGGAYPLLPEGALGGQGECQSPYQFGPTTCIEGGGITPPPDYGPPVGGESPTGTSLSPAETPLTPDEEAGIGSMLAEAIKLVSAGTIKPCAACEKRKRVLNRFGNRVGREILRRLGL